jgi:hypothetical protein
MAERTFEFYGKAYANPGNEVVNITAKFNGIEVYSGPVVTTSISPQAPDNDLLFVCNASTDLSGQVPFEITVSGGTLWFGDLNANFSGIEFTVDRTDPEKPIVTIITPPEDFWGAVNINTEEFDGKSNVTINGTRMGPYIPYQDLIGDRLWQVPDQGTLTCDIFVDPKLISTGVPKEPETLQDPE